MAGARKQILVNPSPGKCEVCLGDEGSVSVRVMGQSSSWMIFCETHAKELWSKLDGLLHPAER